MRKPGNTSIGVATQLLSVAALLAWQEAPANAVLNYYIYQSGPQDAPLLQLDTIGSLNLPSPAGVVNCVDYNPGGAGAGGIGINNGANLTLCTGQIDFFTGLELNRYNISGPIALPYPAYGNFASSGSGSGTATYLNTFSGSFGGFLGLDKAYQSGNAINSSVTFTTPSLVSLGVSTSGLAGTWTLQSNGSDGYTANDSINLYFGVDPNGPPPVPGPLPLLGAATAFGFSRRLRRRIALSSTVHPER